jgi:hypothetical protein
MGGTTVATLSIGTHMSEHWLQVSADHERAARKARARLLELDSTTPPNDEMGAELHAAMVAISAAAHAIDAVYGEIKPHVLIPPALELSWQPRNGKRGVPRHSRIFETLKIGCKLGPRTNQWPGEFKWLYDLRDQVVHHELTARAPAPHPGLPTFGVAQELADYCAENATRALSLALDVAVITVESPRVPGLIERASRMSHVPTHLRALRESTS